MSIEELGFTRKKLSNATFNTVTATNSIVSNTFVSRTTNQNLSLSGTGTGLVQITDGLVLPTTGGTASSLDYYEEGTYTTTFSGPISILTPQTIKFVRVGSMVTIEQPEISAPGINASQRILGDTNAPESIRPSSDVSFVTRDVNNNGPLEFGIWTMTTLGTILIGRTFLNAAFSAGVGTFQVIIPRTFTYSVI